MRYMLIACALVACGPSNSEVKTAKEAHYRGDKIVMFNALRAAVEEKYKLQKSDETSLGLETIARVYTPEGMLANEGNSEKNKSGGYNSMFPDKSIIMSFVVTMLADGDAYVVRVKPMMERYHAGSPKTEPLREDDPSLPGWASGKVDGMQLDIYNALKSYEVKSLGGVAPAPAGPPAPPPDEPGKPAPPPAEPPPAAPSPGY
jgi:hypothetical protein